MLRSARRLPSPTKWTSPAIGEKRGRISLLVKIIAYLAAAVATWLWMGVGSIPLIYLFPLGLAAVFDLHLANDGGWGVLIGGWLVYVVHGFFFFRSRTPPQTLIFYGILLVLLVGNIAGCEKMIHPH